MTRIEEMEGHAFITENDQKYASWAVDIIKRMRPLLQRGFSGTEHAREMAKCNPRLYEADGWPSPCGRCDTCLASAIEIELKEGK